MPPLPLGITLGDANGVGPEIALKAYREGQMAWPFVVIGDLVVLKACNRWLSYGVDLAPVEHPDAARPGAFNVLDLGLLAESDITKGALSAAAGQAALGYLDRAIEEARAGRIAALVTLPMNKEATRLSTPGFSGHTGHIAEACGGCEVTMTLVSDELLVPHVSSHVSLRQAIDGLSTGRILNVIRLTHDVAGALGREGSIAVMGLNPHAGEGGAFGDEDQQIIEPAVRQARAEGISAEGPLPPDTVFMHALKGRYGAVVCMYHDQGHIPMKALGFESTVNVSVGLPFVRTSVDHGTAFDIAYQGVASTGSFIKACALALQLAQGGRHTGV